MAIVTRSKPSKKEQGGSPPSVAAGELSLPEKPSTISHDFARYRVLLYGDMKVGKTSLFGEEEGALFLECDPPQTGLAIMQRHIPNWPTYMGYLKLLDKKTSGKFPYRTGVLDRVDILYDLCYAWCVSNRLGGEDPSDMSGWDRATAWSIIKKTFREGIIRFMSLPWAARFICHGKWKDIEDDDGGKTKVYGPELGRQADSIVTGMVDIIACYRYVGRDRNLLIVSENDIRAGHKCSDNFQTPDGDYVRDIPMGKSAKEAYANLVRAFNNEQSFVSAVDHGKGEKATKKKFRLKK